MYVYIYTRTYVTRNIIYRRDGVKVIIIHILIIYTVRIFIRIRWTTARRL